MHALECEGDYSLECRKFQDTLVKWSPRLLDKLREHPPAALVSQLVVSTGCYQGSSCLGLAGPVSLLSSLADGEGMFALF